MGKTLTLQDKTHKSIIEYQEMFRQASQTVPSKAEIINTAVSLLCRRPAEYKHALEYAERSLIDFKTRYNHMIICQEQKVAAIAWLLINRADVAKEIVTGIDQDETPVRDIE